MQKLLQCRQQQLLGQAPTSAISAYSSACLGPSLAHSTHLCCYTYIPATISACLSCRLYASTGGIKEGTWHDASVKDLMEQLGNTVLPWSGDAVGHDAGLDPRLARIKQQMGMVALDLRAAEHEVRLISYEIVQYQQNIQQECLQLQQQISQYSAELGVVLELQEETEEQLTGVAAAAGDGVDNAYQLQCRYHELHRAALRLQGRMLLLQQKLDATEKLQALALARFARYGASDLQEVTKAAAAAVFAETLGDTAAPATDGDADCSDVEFIYSDSGSDDGAGQQGEAVVPQPSKPPVVLRLTRQWQPFHGPDGIINGNMRQQPWGREVCYGL